MHMAFTEQRQLALRMEEDYFRSEGIDYYGIKGRQDTFDHLRTPTVVGSLSYMRALSVVANAQDPRADCHANLSLNVPLTALPYPQGR